MDENLNPNNPLEDEPDMFKVKEDDDNEPASKEIFFKRRVFVNFLL